MHLTSIQNGVRFWHEYRESWDWATCFILPTDKLLHVCGDTLNSSRLRCTASEWRRYA